ncbi:MAG: alpha/beta fold hydrolase [Rubrimonas sp.]
MSADGFARGGRIERPDGKTLFYAEQPGSTGALPVVCLPGLTRNRRDFAALSRWLARGRRVIAPDMRGRGLSDAGAPGEYTVAHEAGDVLALLRALGVARALFVGTSRGGLIAIALAAAQPDLVAGVALNDIGPALDREALSRLVADLEQARIPEDWAAAAAALQARLGGAFTGLSDDDWDAFARRLWREDEGRPALDYDPAIVTASRAALEQPMPDLWPLFAALSRTPTLAIRGAGSDILTAEGLAAMTSAKPDLMTVEVPGRGHAPFLDEPHALEALARWLERADPA